MDFGEIFGGVAHGPGTNQLDFGGDLITVSLPLFCPNVHTRGNVLVFARWQPCNAGIKTDLSGCLVKLVSLSVEDISGLFMLPIRDGIDTFLSLMIKKRYPFYQELYKPTL